MAVPASYVDKMAELVNLVGAKGSRIPISKIAPLMADGVTYVGEAYHTLHRTVAGMLLWMSFERPDIQFATKRLTQWLAEPLTEDWAAMRKLVRYLLGTKFACLEYDWPSKPARHHC